MLNENIKALRKSKGLSQEELAIKLNVVRQTISKWEKGLSVPDAGYTDFPIGGAGNACERASWRDDSRARNG